MNSEAVYDYSVFKQNIENVRNQTKEIMTRKFQNAKMQLIRDALKDENIIIEDATITSIDSLIQYIKEHFDESILDASIRKINMVEQNMDELLDSLKNNSINGFHRFFQKMGAFLAGSSKSSLTDEERLLITVEGDKEEKKNLPKDNKLDQAYNKILQELEITRNPDRSIVDTRFSKEMQEKIRMYLKNRGIPFEDYGYLSLRNKMQSLPTEQKADLCQYINNALDYKLNPETMVYDATHSEFLHHRVDDVGDVFKTAGTGFAFAEVVNAIDPAIIAAPVNGTFAQKILLDITNSDIVSKMGGWFAGIGSWFLKCVPYAGKFLEGLLKIENIIMSTVAGIGVGVSAVIIKNLYRFIKSRVQSFAEQKDQENLLRFDFEKYGEDNRKELELVHQKQNLLSDHMDSFAVNFFTDYLTDIGVSIEEKPKSVEELENLVKTLPSDKKKEFSKFVSLIQQNEDEETSYLGELNQQSNNMALLGMEKLTPYELYKKQFEKVDELDSFFEKSDVEEENKKDISI